MGKCRCVYGQGGQVREKEERGWTRDHKIGQGEQDNWVH